MSFILMTNQEIAKVLREMAELYEMEGVLFKPRAYEKAAFGVEAQDREIKEIYKESGEKALLKIPGVGPGIAYHLSQLFERGHFKEYGRLKKKIPVNISEITAVEGVGPKMIKILYQKLKVKNLVDLERVAKAGKIRKLAGFGLKSEEKNFKRHRIFKKIRRQANSGVCFAGD